MEVRRIFAAIDVSDEVRVAAAGYISVLRQEFRHLSVGWERPEKLHITIDFAGYLGEAEVNEYKLNAEKAASACSAFTITAAGTGAFIKRSGSNVLWLGLAAIQFAELAAVFRVETKVKRKRPDPFSPHLTIARLREPQNSGSLIDRHRAANFGPLEFTARELVVYESSLLPSGSVYKALSRHPFAG